MVDVWLLLCIFMMFIIIIVHSVIENKLKSKNLKEKQSTTTRVEMVRRVALFSAPKESKMKNNFWISRMKNIIIKFLSPLRRLNPATIGQCSIAAIFIFFNIIYWIMII